MKKSLILSIVMTLVLVISMSTATFAWYTANNSATATVSTITAATADGNLQISTNGADWGSTATITGGTLNPTSPTAAFAGSMADFKAAKWATGSEGNLSFAAASEIVSSSIFVMNDAANGLDVTVDVVIDTQSTTADTYAYILYDATNNKIIEGSDYWTTVEATSAKADAITTTTADTGAAVLKDLKSGNQVELQLIVWFDGWTTTNTEQGDVINMSVTFAGAASQAQS